MSGTATHIRKLDSTRRRALRLLEAADPLPFQPEPEPGSPLHYLEHRRDVAELAVLHKTHVQRVSHLVGLRQLPRVTTRSARTVLNCCDAVELPMSRSCQQQHSFVCLVSRLGNWFTSAFPKVHCMDTQIVKVAAHSWRKSMEPSQTPTYSICDNI